jgi:hypothetical protein
MEDLGTQFCTNNTSYIPFKNMFSRNWTQFKKLPCAMQRILSILASTNS